MSATVYPSAVAAFLRAQIDLDVDTIRAELVDGYTYSDAHEMLDDVTGRFGTAEVVTVDTITSGTVMVDPITFASVPAGDTVTGLVVYRWSGAEATSALICAVTTKLDTTPLSYPTNDGDIVFTFTRGLFKL